MKRDRADIAVAAVVRVPSESVRKSENKQCHTQHRMAFYFYGILPLLTAHAKIGAGILIPL